MGVGRQGRWQLDRVPDKVQPLLVVQAGDLGKGDAVALEEISFEQDTQLWGDQWVNLVRHLILLLNEGQNEGRNGG